MIATQLKDGLTTLQWQAHLFDFFKVEFHTQNSYFTSTFILWALYLGSFFLQ